MWLGFSLSRFLSSLLAGIIVFVMAEWLVGWLFPPPPRVYFSLALTHILSLSLLSVFYVYVYVYVHVYVYVYDVCM